MKLTKREKKEVLQAAANFAELPLEYNNTFAELFPNRELRSKFWKFYTSDGNKISDAAFNLNPEVDVIALLTFAEIG